MARRSGRRTDYEWSHFGDVGTGKDVSTTSAAFGATGLEINIPGTLTRCRGKIGIVLDAAGVNESFICLFGLVIVSDDQFSSTVCPELFSAGQDEASWLWQGSLYVNSGAEAAVIPQFLSANLDVDSKAMRRVKPAHTLALAFQTPQELTVDQGGTWDLSYYIHALFGS